MDSTSPSPDSSSDRADSSLTFFSDELLWSPADAPLPDSASVEAYIDSTVTALLDELLLSPAEARPTITLRSKEKPASCVINPDNGALEAGPQIETYKTYSWRRTEYEARKFTAIIRILEIIEQALRSGRVITKRDIFYMDPQYFRSQRLVDGVVDDIARMIGVDRAALNVEAAVKGLVAGCLCLRNADMVIDTTDTLIPWMEDTVIDTRSPTDTLIRRIDDINLQYTLIPRVGDIEEIDISDVQWVLVIEKEAIFHRLVQSRYHTKAVAGKGVLVTGKGYPDLRTRAFVRRLFDTPPQSYRPRPRFYALVDGDPDGIAIMSTYKYGSAAHARDNARLSVPGLQWLGLRLSDAATGSEPEECDAVLSLTARDRKKIVAMLRNSPVCASDGPEPEWRAELQRMLMLNAKAEIEILYDRAGELEGWIDREMILQA